MLTYPNDFLAIDFPLCLEPYPLPMEGNLYEAGYRAFYVLRGWNKVYFLYTPPPSKGLEAVYLVLGERLITCLAENLVLNLNIALEEVAEAQRIRAEALRRSEADIPW